MLLDAGAHPVVFWVVADGVVLGVHQENLKVLEGGVLANPVRVEDAEGTAMTANTLLGNRLETTSELHEDTLGHGLLATAATDADSVNNKTLGGLVAKTTGLLGASWLRGTVDRVQVAILPDANPLQVAH